MSLKNYDYVYRSTGSRKCHTDLKCIYLKNKTIETIESKNSTEKNTCHRCLKSNIKSLDSTIIKDNYVYICSKTLVYHANIKCSNALLRPTEKEQLPKDSKACTNCITNKRPKSEAGTDLVHRFITRYRKRQELRKRSTVYNLQYRLDIIKRNKNGHVFNLTDEQIKHMLKQDCFYCSKKITALNYNGIDRIDNNKGYTVKNTRACCWLCNRMKLDKNVCDFIQCVFNIYYYSIDGRNADLINYNSNPLALNLNTIKYDKYVQSALVRDISFKLTKEQFTDLAALKCHYCGLPGPNGLDRKDNTAGYTLENSVASCTQCNYMKNVTTYQVFLDTVKNITNKWSWLLQAGLLITDTLS